MTNKTKKQARGRPKKYTTKEEIQQKIDKYFDSCFRYATTKEGIPIPDPENEGKFLKVQYKPFTISGLADALDMSRETLLKYEQSKKFSDIIEKAKRKCEVYAEERLFDRDGANGAKFNLVNNYNGWKDKQELEHSGKIKLEDIL